MINAHYKKTFANFELDAEFEIPATGITILFGPSGSGKSTLLNCIAGLDKANVAYLKINENFYDNKDLNIRLTCQQRQFGYVFQDNRLFPHMTVLGNLEYGFKRVKHHNHSIDINELIEKFSLTNLLEQFPHQLSGGQKQRVALARSILIHPRLLILDEPMSALDYAARQELYPYLEYIHKELTIPIIYISHDLKEVLQLGDYILVMDNGKIIDQGDLVDLCVSQPLLTQDEGTSFILQGTVTNTDEQHCITTVNCKDHDLLLSGKVLEIEKNIRILVHAKDVSLSLTHVDDSSILNVLKTNVSKINPPDNGKQLIELIIGETKILAMLSLRSVNHLGLKPGLEVFAQMKATAVVR